jgi:hypothetical protein
MPDQILSSSLDTLNADLTVLPSLNGFDSSGSFMPLVWLIC